MIKKIYILWLMLTTSLAFSAEDPAMLFLNKISSLWSSSIRLEKLNAKIVNSGFAIMRPPLTWISLIRLEGIDFEGKGFAHCLYYLVPRHSKIETLDQPGLLKIVDVLQEENCNDKYVRTGFAFLKGVDQLYFYLSSQGTRDYQGNNLKPNQIVFKFFYHSKEVQWEIPLYNVASGKIKSPTAKRMLDQWDLRPMPTREAAYIPGMHFGPIAYKSKASDPQIMWQNYSMENSESVCMAIDDKCEVKGPISCELCGHAPISANARGCATSFHKICGKGQCGERNMPACPRGNYYLTNEFDPANPSKELIEEPCSEGEKSGICRNDLKPFCNENGIQICI